MKFQENSRYIYAAILLLAALLRLIASNQSLWLDEAIQFSAVWQNSLIDLWTTYLPGDFNPPLSYLVSWVTVRLFGTTEIALRLPSILFGVITVWLGMQFAKQLSDSKQQKYYCVSVGILLATAPLLIYYSHEGRSYSVATMLSIWSLFSLWKFIHNKGSYWGYIISTSLLFWSHYLAWFIWIVEVLFVLIYKPKKNYLLSISVPLLSIVPLLPLLVNQVQTGAAVSQTLPVWQSLGQFSVKQLLLIPAKIITGRLPLDLVWWQIVTISIIGLGWVGVVGSGVSKIINSKNREDSALISLVCLWLCLPIIIAIGLSTKLAVFTYFRFLYIVPAFYILFVFGVSKINRQWHRGIVGMLCIVNLACSGLYLLNPLYHREDWKSLVRYINQKNLSDSVVIIKSINSPFWYYDQNRHRMVDFKDIENVQYEKSLWYVSYAQPIFEPDNNTFKLLTDTYGFKVFEQKVFRGDVIVYYLENPSGLIACKAL